MNKSRVFIIIILWISALSVKSQQNVFIGDNMFPATETISFKCQASSHWSGPYLTFVKKPNGSGYLYLHIHTGFKEFYSFSGNVTVFLEDGRKIICVDRGLKDVVNNDVISIYSLTSKEIEMLKESNIQGIRFNIKGIQGSESFIGTNEKEGYLPTGIGGSTNCPCNTVRIISNLFQ